MATSAMCAGVAHSQFGGTGTGLRLLPLTADLYKFVRTGPGQRAVTPTPRRPYSREWIP